MKLEMVDGKYRAKLYCFNCGHEGFFILDDTDNCETRNNRYELWKCMKCGAYHKVKYRLDWVRRLEVCDEMLHKTSEFSLTKKETESLIKEFPHNINKNYRKYRKKGGLDW